MQGYINYKSNREAVVKRLLLDYLNSYLNYVLINSAEGEQTARQIAMHNAIENAHELLDELKLTYNHVRQNVITTKLLKYLAVPICELIVRSAD